MKINRRQFSIGVLASAFVAALPLKISAKTIKTNKGKNDMTFTLPELPYADTALEPHMSAKTFSFHHAKHHNAYVTNLNKLIEGTDFAGKSLEEIVKSSDGGVFNNAAQVWNHQFFWNSLSPNGGGKPTGAIAEKIDASFGSYDKFREEFANAGATQFGSGWAWLVLDGDALKIVKTANAETPITGSVIPLLTIDVWEHAYYLDFQNARPGFIASYLDNLVNWDFANENLARGDIFKVYG